MKKISLILISCVSLFALNIEEAVKVGLENSHRLKSSQLNQNVSQAYLEKPRVGIDLLLMLLIMYQVVNKIVQTVV